MAAEFKIGRLRYTWKGAWNTNTFYNRDAVASFDGKTYVCLIPHTSNVFYDDYTYVDPVNGPSPYWTLMLDGTAWKGEWQPFTNYTLGNIVLFGGSLYKRIVNAVSGATFNTNNWEIYIDVGNNWTGEWGSSTLYVVGDIAKYGGIVYKCIVEHTSAPFLETNLSNWEILEEGIEYRGNWNPASTRYKTNDVVKYGPDLWIANRGHTSALPFDATATIDNTLPSWRLWLPGLEYTDTWNSTTVYNLGEVVKYGGYSYVNLIVNNTNILPTVLDGSWEIVTTGYDFQNEWSSGSTYLIGSVVRRGGSLFEAVQTNQAQDPSLSSLTVTYTALGSSGTTLVVNSTVDIVPGMIISGNGFELGQYVVAVVDETTLTISAAPYSTITDATSLLLTGVDGTNWKLITPGIRWRNRWIGQVDYIVGDIAVWKNTTYRCIRTHSSLLVNRPDLNFDKDVWIIYLPHDQYNVLNVTGDLVVNTNGVNEALPIGPEGYLLKSVNGIPTWSNVFQTTAVYYVTPDGTDEITSGATWDNPYKSIKYACERVAEGVYNTEAKDRLVANKNFLVEETIQWQLYQISGNIAPFLSSTILDVGKTRRDASYLIDAIIYDLSRNGNSQIVAFVLSFFDREFDNKFVTDEVAAQIDEFIASLNYLFDITIDVLTGITVSPSYIQLNNSSPALTQISGLPIDSLVINTVETYRAIVIPTLVDGNISNVPPENQGLTSTIMVKTGTYSEELPIVLPANTALVGDELRGTTVSPKNIINTIVTRSFASTDTFVVSSTAGMLTGTAVQFVSLNPVDEKTTIFGGVTAGQTYYIVGTVTDTQFQISTSLGGSPVSLANFIGVMRVYGGDALRDMFYVQNATGIRNMTLTGLLGTLTDLNDFNTRRPTGGSYVSLDPGSGPDDTSTWIIKRSPYIQNVTTFGIGCVGMKVDGTLHNGGNKSIVANDFTHILSDGIGAWITGPDALSELVSIFSYYNYAGYLAEDGGRVRATNGNSSYGNFGVIAEGFNDLEVPVGGAIDNRYFEATATPLSSLGSNAEILKLQYSHAGEDYLAATTNLVNYSNGFTNWTSDNNITLVQSIVSPFGQSNAWLAIGNTSATDSSFFYQDVAITPSGAQYTEVSGTNVPGFGSGTGATFNVTVTSTEYLVNIFFGGSNYVATNKIRILGSQLGGIDGDNDLVITVTGLVGTSISQISITPTIDEPNTVQIGSIQPYTFSIYCKKGTAPSFDIAAIFSGFSTATSRINFNFNTLTITPTSSTGGLIPSIYSAIPVSGAAGWYRLSFRFNDVSALNSSLRIQIYPRSQFGNSGFTVLYGAQLEIGSDVGFYLDNDVGRFTAYANYEIVGAGSGVKVIGEEIRSNSVYQTRLLEVNGITGGKGYLISSNNAQSGDERSIVIAASDVAGDKTYLGMRIFINSGSGAGQYGIISYFDTLSKTVYVIKESYKLLPITSTDSVTDDFTIDTLGDANSLYVGQVVQFVPTSYTTVVTKVSQNSITVTSTTGGIINEITVSSTARLTENMPIEFSGVTFGGVTSNFTYFVLSIVDDTRIQVSTTVGGAVVLLTTVTGLMTLNYPDSTSYLQGPTANMAVNLPIYFTGITLSSVVAGVTYFINEIFDSGNFTISPTLITPTATNTTAISNVVTVDDTAGLTALNPIIFTGTGFGNIVPATKYFINHIVNATTITISPSVITTSVTATRNTSNLITVESTAGFIIGNPIVFTGTTFGGLAVDQTYFVLYVANTTTFSVSNTSVALTITATATIASTDPTRPNQITVASSNNLAMLNPIVFSGTTFGGITAGVQYFVNRIIDAQQITVSSSIISATATETAVVSNLITVTSTNGFIPGNPVIFSGNTFGGIISGTVYYVSAVNNETTFTVSATPGGSAVALTTATGSVTVRTTSENVTLTTGSGSFVGTTRASNTPVSLTTATGSCIARTTAPSVTLTTGTGTLTATTTSAKLQLATDFGSMNGIFEVPLLGGVTLGTQYYIKSITLGFPNKFTISAVSAVGPTLNLTNSSGSMQLGEVGWDNVNPGSELAPPFGSSTVYSIEPRISYNEPGYNSSVSSIISQAPGVSYVGIAYGNARFAAIPNSGNVIAFSETGTIWSQLTLPVSGTWSGIAFGNKYWVIISSQGTSPGSTVLYSNSNLATWKSATLPSVANWSKVVYGNGRFVAITSNSNATAFSVNNGATWSSGGALSGTTWSSIAYGNNRFVVITSTGTAAAYSTTGVSWTSVSLPINTTWSSIAYGNGRFVAVSSTASQAIYSLDGIVWNTSPYNVTATNLTYGDGVFLATGHQPLAGPLAYTSEDGLAWTIRSSQLDMGAVAFGFTNLSNGLFVSVSGQNLSNIISAGSITKARATVFDGVITGINEWDPGSNYNNPPIVTVSDSNATQVASLVSLIGDGVLANPTFLSRGSGYNTNTTSINITGLGYADNFQLGNQIIIADLDKLPSAGDNLAILNNSTIYKVTSAVVLDGTVEPNILALVAIDPPMTVGLSPSHTTPVSIRTKYSQVRLTNHDFLNIGFGNFEQSNYPRLPETTVLSPQNEAIESNFGRVFYSSTDQDGNFRVGKLFAVEKATGIVTLSASQFGLSGLTELKIGGVAVGGNSVIITQFSTDSTFVANSNQIIPTQKAIKSYLTSRLSQGGSNTFTGELIAGTVIVGGPDEISSTIPEGSDGSVVNMPNLTNIRGIGDGGDGGYGGVDGDAMALAFFMKHINNR